MLLVREFNYLAEKYGMAFVLRARSSKCVLPLINVHTLESRNSELKSTYWIPAISPAIIRMLLALNCEVVRVQVSSRGTDSFVDAREIPPVSGTHLMTPECTYPTSLVANVGASTVRGDIERVSQVMEPIIKRIVEFAAVAMITVKHFPSMNNEMCCKLALLPINVVNFARTIDVENANKSKAKKAKKDKVAATSGDEEPIDDDAATSAPEPIEDDAQDEEDIPADDGESDEDDDAPK